MDQNWLIAASISALSICVGWFLVWLASEMKETRNLLIAEVRGVRDEMSDLNKKLAQVVTNQDWHSREILRLEQRINDIEDYNRG